MAQLVDNDWIISIRLFVIWFPRDNESLTMLSMMVLYVIIVVEVTT